MKSYKEMEFSNLSCMSVTSYSFLHIGFVDFGLYFILRYSVVFMTINGFFLLYTFIDVCYDIEILLIFACRSFIIPPS